MCCGKLLCSALRRGRWGCGVASDPGLQCPEVFVKIPSMMWRCQTASRAVCFKVGVLTIAKESEIKISWSTAIDNISKQTEKQHKKTKNPQTTRLNKRWTKPNWKALKLENVWTSVFQTRFSLFIFKNQTKPKKPQTNKQNPPKSNWNEDRRVENHLEGELPIFHWFRTVGFQRAPYQGGRVTKRDGAAACPQGHCWEHCDCSVGWSSKLIWKSTADECLVDKCTTPLKGYLRSVLMDAR